MGGGSTGVFGSTSGAKVPLNKNLTTLMQNILAQAAPARKLEFQQLTEALQSGGVGARIPIIQRAVEAAMAGNQQAATEGRQTTARAGLSGSAFDVAQQLGTNTANSARVAGIGPQYAAGLIQQGPAMIDNATSQALNIGQMQQQNAEFNAGQTSKFYEDLKDSLSSWASHSSSPSTSQATESAPTSINYEQTGQSNPQTFDPSGAQFQE